MITWSLDSGVARAKLAAFEKQAASALAVTLNRTMEEAHVAGRDHLESRFTIRNRALYQWIFPLPLPNVARATRERLRVVSETFGYGRVFNPFQRGEPKLMRSPDVPVAVPTQRLRWTPQTVIPGDFYPSNLGLVPRRSPKTSETYYALGKGSIKKGLTPFKRTAGGKVQIKGKLRTFVLDPRYHEGVDESQWGVYIRTGPDSIRMLWSYRRQVRRPPILGFEEPLVATFNQRIQRNWEEALAYELATGQLSRSRTTSGRRR